MPTLGWKTCAPGTLVQVSDAEDLRRILEKYETLSMPIDSCVSLFAGQRCFVVEQPKTKLQIVESDGRVVCQLVRNDTCRALLPVSVLWKDGKEEELLRETEMALKYAAEILQHWWRTLVQIFSSPPVVTLDTVNDEIVDDDDKSSVVSTSSSSQPSRVEDKNKAITTIQSQFRRYSSCLKAISLQESAARCCREHTAAIGIQCAFRQVAGTRERRARERLRDDEVNEMRRREEEANKVAEERCFLSLDQLMAAAREGNEAVIHQALAVLGVDDTDRDGSSALALACENGHLTIAKLLYANGANQNLRNKAGWTPLHRACFGGHANVVRWLVSEAGADIAARNNRGSCATHACVPGGHIGILRLLSDAPPVGLDRSDLLDITNSDGDTPLHFAVMCRQIPVIDYLLSKERVSMTMTYRTNRDGMTPLQLAEKSGEHAMISLLTAASSRVSSNQDPLPVAARKPKKMKRKVARKHKEPPLPKNPWSMCTNMQQALTLAWKLASEEKICRELIFFRRDVRIVLSGLGIFDDEPQTDECADADDFCVIDLGSAEAVANTLQAAATHYNFALSGRVSMRRAGIAQKRLLQYIRSPAPALRHIHDAGKISCWTQADIEELLGHLQAPADALPSSYRQSGQDLLDHLMLPEPIAIDGVAVSALMRARITFHLSILRHLAGWQQNNSQSHPLESGSCTSAGSGAAHALALQRGVIAKATSDDDEDVPAQPEIKLYRPLQTSRAMQRVEEIAELEAQQYRHRTSARSPPTPPPQEMAQSVSSSNLRVPPDPVREEYVPSEIEVIGHRLTANPRPPSRGTARPASRRVPSADIYRPTEQGRHALHTMVA